MLFQHDLSKRTALYTTLTRINNDDGFAISRSATNHLGTGARLTGLGLGENATQFSMGIRHMF